MAGTEILTIEVNPPEGENKVVILLHLQQPPQALIHAVTKDTNEAVGGMEMTIGEWLLDLEKQQVEHVAEFAHLLGIDDETQEAV